MFVWILAIFRRKSTHGDEVDTKVFSWFASFVLVCIGFIGVLVGGQWIVDGAETIATMAGVSASLIGLTILAFGTAIPNFIVTFVAAARGHMGIAIGSIVGSNIFYFFGIMGFAAVIEPIAAPYSLLADLVFASMVALLLFLFARFGSARFTLTRGEGILFLLLYAAYVAFLIVRG